jgi:hypothetical protein
LEKAQEKKEEKILIGRLPGLLLLSFSSRRVEEIRVRASHERCVRRGRDSVVDYGIVGVAMRKEKERRSAWRLVPVRCNAQLLWQSAAASHRRSLLGSSSSIRVRFVNRLLFVATDYDGLFLAFGLSTTIFLIAFLSPPYHPTSSSSSEPRLRF